MNAYLIQGINQGTTQNFNLSISDGSIVNMTIYYIPQQMGWFYDLSWNNNTSSITLNGRRIVCSPNMLRQYQNNIPFGLGCSTADNTEPMNVTDFTSGFAELFLLDGVGVFYMESNYYAPHD